MVRLKGYHPWYHTPYYDAFQFQNGTIKRMLQRNIWKYLQSFNSKMVRLKDWQEMDMVLHLYKFQFQNGTIKRQKAIADDMRLRGFQFQNGTIKRR